MSSLKESIALMPSERKNLKGYFFLSFDEKFPALSPPQTWMQCLRLAEVQTAEFVAFGGQLPSILRS